MIQVQAPDGTIIQFPDGTPASTINTQMGAYHAATQSRAAAGSFKHPGQEAIFNGLMFNQGPRVAGADAAITTAIDNLFPATRHPYGAADAYGATKAVEQRLLDTYGTWYPGRSLAANLAGAAANPVSWAGGSWINGAKTTAGAVGRGALVGGVPGYVAGGPTGAVIGAVTGGAVPLAAGGARATVNGAGAVVNNARRATGLMKPAQVATQRLSSAMAKDIKAGVDPVANLQSWPGASQPTLADVGGENVRAVIRDAGTQGPARTALAGYRDQVAADLQDHALALTSRLTPGETRTAQQYGAALRESQQADADRLYPSFQSDRLPVNDQVASALSGNTGARAISSARQLADAMRDQGALSEIASLSGGQLPADVSAGTLDLIRRGLRDRATAAFKAGENTMGGGLQGRSNDLEQVLLASPNFDAARSNFRDWARRIEGVDNGSSVLTSPPSDYAASVASDTPGVIDAARVGARQALSDAIGRPTEGATGVLNRISTATNPGQNLALTFGDDAADAYRQGLQAEADRMANANWMAPQMGAKTFSSAQDAAHGLLHGPIALVGGVLKRVVSGAPLNDAERAALVSPAIDQLTPELLTALMKKAPGSGLFGSGYASAPVASLTAQAAP